MEDWNWFFTALSQSNAAIVGFIGGFTITKTIGKESEFNGLQEKTNDFIIRSDDQKRRVEKRYFKWLTENQRRAILESEEYFDLVKKGSGQLNLDDVLPELGFSKYDSRPEIVAQIESEWGTVAPNQKFSPDYLGSLVSASASASRSKMEVEEREMIDSERVSTIRLIEEMKLHSTMLSRFPSEKRSIYSTLIALTALFILGVIYPLSFTPISGSPVLSTWENLIPSMLAILISIKGFFLCISAALFCYLVAFFSKKLSSLNFNQETLRNFELRSDLGYYSRFFQQWQECN